MVLQLKTMPKYIVWFKEVDKQDIPLVGGKGANLGEMEKANFPIPPGFIVTAEAYTFLLTTQNLHQKIANYLALLDVNNPPSLDECSKKIKEAILRVDVPQQIQEETKKAYQRLGKSLFVAVRSSATAEDLPTASFAGQQRTFLNIKGEKDLIEAVQGCWASLFEPRAIFYREEKGFDHFKVKIACIVQKMIQSDVSGVAFTIDPVTNDKSKIIVEAIYGLGELIVGGKITPDHYVVAKRNLKIEKKEINPQKRQLVKVGAKNKEIKVSLAWQKKQKLSDELIIKLAKICQKIEKHYFFPQDIEWAVEHGKIFIVQTRPVTTIGKWEALPAGRQVGSGRWETQKLKLLLTGAGASPGIAWGPVRIVPSKREIGKILVGDVLVTPMTDPNFVPAMRKAVAIITDKGGRTSHAAIVSRELGIPCVVGTKTATKVLKEGLVVTVDGEKGRVYRGGNLVSRSKGIKYKESKEIEVTEPRMRTATKIYVNLGEPDLAKEVAQKNVDGVGLLRAEFMMAQIGEHPKKMVREKREKEFVKKLSHGLLEFCQAFNPRPVVYRASDFKTNEYKALKGGRYFEPEEENPFLGYRGCFRYLKDPKVFELELEAIKKVKDNGFGNLWLMLPFIRTIKELSEAKRIVNQFIKRSPSFKLWMMVEVPSNVILLEDFLKVGIDGVSIGSNDLTMLLLGMDRDNVEIAPSFDERNPAVLWALERVIKVCQKVGVSSSICGQAPSVYPDLVEKLVDWGITSISVNPDAIERTREIVYEVEKKIVNPKRIQKM